MQQRLDYARISPETYAAMLGLERQIHNSPLPPNLLHLVKLRASQINGCAYCIDMHWKDLRALGESEQRLYGLDAWREAPYYDDRERAALAWTEAVTDIARSHAPDEPFAELSRHFTPAEIGALTWAIAAINVWNRVAIGFRTEAGTYVSRLRPAAG